jgi:hypothetical protein
VVGYIGVETGFLYFSCGEYALSLQVFLVLFGLAATTSSAFEFGAKIAAITVCLLRVGSRFCTLFTHILPALFGTFLVQLLINDGNYLQMSE